MFMYCVRVLCERDWPPPGREVGRERDWGGEEVGRERDWEKD